MSHPHRPQSRPTCFTGISHSTSAWIICESIGMLSVFERYWKGRDREGGASTFGELREFIRGNRFIRAVRASWPATCRSRGKARDLRVISRACKVIRQKVRRVSFRWYQAPATKKNNGLGAFRPEPFFRCPAGVRFSDRSRAGAETCHPTPIFWKKQSAAQVASRTVARRREKSRWFKTGHGFRAAVEPHSRAGGLGGITRAMCRIPRGRSGTVRVRHLSSLWLFSTSES